jgi:hypothetical protein
MNTTETNKLLEDGSRVDLLSDDALQTALNICFREKWNATIDDRDTAILEAKKLREQNAKLREIAESAIDWLNLGNPDDVRAGAHIRGKLDQLKEAAK